MPSDSRAAPRSKPVTVYIVAFIAIATTSSAAILIRYALNEDMPPVLIVAARLCIASLALTPIALKRYGTAMRALSRRDLALIALSGICLAAHFTSWVSSLQLTTVLVSVVLVSTGPIWTAILEVIILRIRLSRLVMLGLLVALLGGALIGIPLDADGLDLAAIDGDTISGGFLAWLGALAISVYMLIGRKLRAKLPTVPYVWLVYSIAAAAMLIVIAATATPTLGYSAQGYLILLAMGLIPQLIGHSSFNYLLAYFPAALVSMISQLEPLGSAALAVLLFQELPPNQQILGSMIIVLGVLFASRGEIRPVEPAE